MAQSSLELLVLLRWCRVGVEFRLHALIILAMIEHLQYVFSCKHCSWPIRLLAQTLGQPFGNPAHRSIRVDSVGAACSHCRHVANYSLHKNSLDYDPLGRAEVSAPSKETVAVVRLGCVEGSCKTPLEVFAAWSATTTVEERSADIKTWLWDGLHCPQGHEIKAPRNWIGDPPVC